MTILLSFNVNVIIFNVNYNCNSTYDSKHYFYWEHNNIPYKI